MNIKHNILRLSHLLRLYNISVKEFLEKISKGLKNPITEKEIFSDEIKLTYLKRIDKIFNKGLHYYLDPKAPESSKEASIFFRKETFNSELNLGAKKIVTHFEEFKISLSAIAKLADLNITRTLPYYNISDDPKNVAIELRSKLYPEFTENLRDFLKSLIVKFAENNILVFEFVETWNKRDKANIDGFFLSPNVIVLKRHQKYFRREIFTLIHELGHFLLNEEEIEKLDYEHLANRNISLIEKWCNDFAYYFLVGNYFNEINKISNADSSNDYQFDVIEKISKYTNLSQIALFTRLLFDNKISQNNYDLIREDFNERFKKKLEEEKRQKELDKEQGKKNIARTPEPIKSPLLISTIQTAFYEGILNEFEVCQQLNIKPDKISEYIQ